MELSLGRPCKSLYQCVRVETRRLALAFEI